MLPSVKIIIIKSDHRFYYEQTMSEKHFCAYYESDDFILQLGLGAGGCVNRVFYKNTRLSGGINAFRWSLEIYKDKSKFAEKSLSNGNEHFYFYDGKASKTIRKNGVEEAEKNSNNSNIRENTVDSSKVRIDENKLFEMCVSNNEAIYNLIEDKENFKIDLLCCEAAKNLFGWNYLDDSEFEKDDELEMAEDIEEFVTLSEMYFEAFYEGEHCEEIVEKRLTKQVVYAKYPNVREIIDDETLEHLIGEFKCEFKEEDEDYKEEYRSIYFNNKEFIEKTVESFYWAKIRNLFVERIKERYTRQRLNNIYQNEMPKVSKPDDLLNELEKYVSASHEENEELFLFNLNNFVNSYIKYDDYYRKFNAAFGGDIKWIDLNVDKAIRFHDYKKGIGELSKIEQNEYELAYKVILPSYNSYFYYKNGKTLHPSVKRVPVYFEFIKKLYARLIKDEILVEKDGKLDFNCVEKVADLGQEECNPLEYYKTRAQRIILESVEAKADISVKELGEKTGYSDRVVREHLSELCRNGYIQKVEEGNRHYYIVKHE